MSLKKILEECKIVSRKFDIPNAHTLEVALKHGAYNCLEKLFSTSQQDIIQEIKDSGLRGKGGGGGATGPRWANVHKHNPDKRPSYMVINADESEPGTFKDREIMQKDPHLLLEGIIVASYAIAAKKAYIYIRGEYAAFARRLNEAIAESYAKGILGEQIKDPYSGKIYDWSLDITVHRGAGAYICGEKTALLESLEGKRGQPRLKPKDKSEPEWFFGYPAMVNNVETVSTAPFIVKNGAGAYRAFGTEKSPGTLLVGMSGHINNGGIWEAPYGLSMIEFIEEIGGGIPQNRKLKAVIPGGSSCHVLTADEARQCHLDYESPWQFGSSLGTAGMIIMDETVNMMEAMKNLLEFYRHESCGQCTPCREGTGWTDRTMAKILKGQGTSQDVQIMQRASEAMNGKTICLFGPSVSAVIDSYTGKFADEFQSYIKKQKQNQEILDIAPPVF